jgi:hypothetical protein
VSAAHPDPAPGPRWRSPWTAWWIVAATALAALATWLLLPARLVLDLMGETGPVESLTAAAYVLCAVAIAWAHQPGDDRRDVLALCVVMLAFGARELDWHKAFTGASVLKLSWYAGNAPLAVKASAAAIVLVVAAAVVWLAMRHTRPLWAGLRRRAPLAVTVLAFMVTLGVAKTLDRSVAILAEDFGVPVSLPWRALRSALEEWLELALSMLTLLGLAQRRWARRTPGG